MDWSVQQQQRAGAATDRPLERGHPADPVAARTAAGGRGGDGAARAHVVDRCRRAARTGPNGELIPLDEQDRSLWDRDQIAEGVGLTTRTLCGGSIGWYQLQAAIAAIHDEAARVEDTDWPQILALYALLLRISDNPMVALNHAIAAAMVHGPEAGLELLKPLDADGKHRGHYRLDAVRGHLFQMTGDRSAAIAHFRAPAERTASLPERNHLLVKAARLA